MNAVLVRRLPVRRGVLTAGSSPQDDLLSDVQELARQRLSADERAVLAATVPESAQRQLLDDTSYALQVCFVTILALC